MLAVLAACSNTEREVTLAFSTELPAPSIAEAVRTHLADDGFDIVLAEGTNPQDIVESIQNRSMDLGVLEEPDHPIPGIVTIAPLYPSVLHVLYKAASKPQDLAELIRGTNVYAGPSGGAADRLIRQLASDANLADNEFELLDNPWTIDPDVYFIFGGLLSNESVLQLSGYRLFSFADETDVAGGSVADAIVLKHHHLKTFLLPKGTYQSISDGPITTLSIRTVMIAHEDFSADSAFSIASNLFNNAQEYSLDYPLVMRELNTRFNPIELMLPLHTGSRRFINRDEPGLIERYVDIIALLFTLAIAIGSGIYTLYRRHLQVKKDRLDRYYTQLLQVRSEANANSEVAQIRDSKLKAVSVQEEVLNLLIEERVSADASLVAFLSLSNQIINELDQRINSDR